MLAIKAVSSSDRSRCMARIWGCGRPGPAHFNLIPGRHRGCPFTSRNSSIAARIEARGSIVPRLMSPICRSVRFARSAKVTLEPIHDRNLTPPGNYLHQGGVPMSRPLIITLSSPRRPKEIRGWYDGSRAGFSTDRRAVRRRRQTTASCCRQERWWCCVKKVRERHAVREMKADPSEPSCRGRLQTAMSCFGQKLG